MELLLLLLLPLPLLLLLLLPPMLLLLLPPLVTSTLNPQLPFLAEKSDKKNPFVRKLSVGKKL